MFCQEIFIEENKCSNTTEYVDWGVKHQQNMFCIMGSLILVSSVCLCPIKRTLGLYGLICAIIKQCCVSVLSLYFTIQFIISYLPCI